MYLYKHVLAALAATVLAGAVIADEPVLQDDKLKAYVELFNRVDPEPFTNTWSNAKALEFLSANIPRFDCPDKDIEQAYYFRWWTFRKHLIKTPEGWVISEFVPTVSWSGPYNTINCANSHHIREGRWLKDPRYVSDNIRFWLKAKHGNYSNWLLDSMWQYSLVTGDYAIGAENLPDLMKYYKGWEGRRDKATGLFFSIDQGDGMEASISGKGFRPTLNSYMYGNALALAGYAQRAGDAKIVDEYNKKAAEIKEAVQKLLWNAEHEFFEVREGPLEMGFFGWRVNNDPELTGTAKLTCSTPKKPDSLVGGENLKNGWDWSLPRAHFFVPGAQHWMQYDFPRAVSLSSTELFLMYAGRTGLPESYRVLYRENDQWKEVANLEGEVATHHRWNVLTFSPVTTDGLRVEMKGYGYTRETLAFLNVREQLGFIPWYFNLPDPQFSVAWKQVADTNGFAAAWGLTTAEQRHPKFAIEYHRHPCLWNGPVWPYATAQTLTALANVLNNYEQDIVDRNTYYSTLRTYARSHQRTLEDGSTVPWLDECQNPYTGDWIARTVIHASYKVKPERLKKPFAYMERGKDYNHSTFCDLVINGLVGLRPQSDETIVVNPLVPPDTWDWFCLDRVPYQGRMLTIIWDKTGKHYGKGAGLSIWSEGKEIARSEKLSRLDVRL